MGTPGREHSVRQMIDRVADTIADWGVKDAYFATDEDADALSPSSQARNSNRLSNRRTAGVIGPPSRTE
jgi:hypothetical protein